MNSDKTQNTTTNKAESLEHPPQFLPFLRGWGGCFGSGLGVLAMLGFLLHTLERVLSGHGFDYVFYEVRGIQENMYVQEFTVILLTLLILTILLMRWLSASLKERFNWWLRVEGRNAKKKKGKRSGEICEYYIGHALKARRRYKHGKLHGECREYYENGKVKTIQEYQGGKLHGVVKEYDATGTLLSRKVYINGKEQSSE